MTAEDNASRTGPGHVDGEQASGKAADIASQQVAGAEDLAKALAEEPSDMIGQAPEPEVGQDSRPVESGDTEAAADEEEKASQPVESDDAEPADSEVGQASRPVEASGTEPNAVEPIPDDAIEEAIFEAVAETTESVAAEELVTSGEAADGADRALLKAIFEAVIYVTDEPLTAQQIATAVQRPIAEVQPILDELVADYARPERGLSIREVAGGYKMATKAEHHEAIRTFVKNLKPPLKLSLAALETLAVIAYKQPITAPEIMEIRGVQGAGVLKTLLDRKLIATAGRKNVIGKPILYKTTKEFLVQFGLKDLSELPTLKEFEELGRLALSDEPSDAPAPPQPAAANAVDTAEPETPVEEPPAPEEPPVEEPNPDPQPEIEPPPDENA